VTERHYHINVFWSAEDQCWIADVPDLQHCSAHGETPVEALEQVETAIEAWIEAQAEAGHPIPEPRYRPAIYAARPAA
jgi:predicted RNase H-like HicB family nuclease